MTELPRRDFMEGSFRDEPRELSILSFGPNVRTEAGVIKARTSIPFSLVSLGLCQKRVEVDLRERVFRVLHWNFWVFPKRWTIPFSEVSEIKYSYRDLKAFLPSPNMAGNAWDSYSISLKLHDGHEILLFRWIGEGEFSNESILPDWFYALDYEFDTVGTQKKESLLFYELMNEMVYKPKSKIFETSYGRESF